MISNKYIDILREQIKEERFEKKIKFFIFGSSIKRKRFGDLDVGFIGSVQEQKIRRLKEKLEDSNIPYFVDIINFNNASKSFSDNVFSNKVLWIKR